jgi:proton glutamate symport protein
MPKIKLHWLILLGILFGVLAGWAVHSTYALDEVPGTAIYQSFDLIATLFLRLLKMVVLPLVFFSLICGMLGMGDLAGLGRTGGKVFVLYMITTLLALLTGLALVNLIRPGEGLLVEVPTEGVLKQMPDSFVKIISDMVPSNVVGAAAEFDLLGVIIFALFFGACMLRLEGHKKQALFSFMEAASDVMMKMTVFIISLAPIGIAALIARMISSTGPEVIWQMRWYMATVVLALGIHALITLPGLVYLLTRRNPYRFLRVMSPALMTGFSTASSSGTLGVTMERAEKGAGISNRVASFVLPIGATINMDGTALYEIVTVLFIAQFHASIDPAFSLGFSQQLLIVFLGLVVSVGAAGIPHAGLVMMVIILEAVGLPIEYTALIWTVDRVLDMCRTATNLTSDSCVTLIVAHSEGEIEAPVSDTLGSHG